MEKLDGRLEPFAQTATEGIEWTLLNRVLPGYAGLHALTSGDVLTIFDDAGGHLWHGVVDFEYQRRKVLFPQNPEYEQQALLGYWVHGLQSDCEPETWAGWFFDRRRATVQPKVSRPPHAFSMPAAELAQATANLSFTEYFELYHAARRAWIDWADHRIGARSSRMQCFGVHAELGFTEAEALRIIGSPPIETIRAWQSSQTTVTDSLLPGRLALLSGITGRLFLIFGTAARIKPWMARQAMHDRPMREAFFSDDGLVDLHDHMRQMVEQPPYGFLIASDNIG